MANESTATKAALEILARHQQYLQDAKEAPTPEPFMQHQVDSVTFGRWLMRVSPQERAQKMAEMAKTMPPEQVRGKVAGALKAAMKAKGMM